MLKLQHKSKADPNSFTARYNIDQLVYYECYANIVEAIARESSIKNMHRLRKIELIVASNPTWQDLSAPLGKPIPAFDETKMQTPIAF